VAGEEAIVHRKWRRDVRRTVACLRSRAIARLSLLVVACATLVPVPAMAQPTTGTLGLASGSPVSFGAPDGPILSAGNSDRGVKAGATAGAPHVTPVYEQPANDAVALGMLIDGAGYGASSNSDWSDIASGNFCGGAEKELLLVKNKHSNFSIMRGPVPYAAGAFDLESNASHPWRAAAAGNLDADPFDEIAAVRKVTATGVADVVLMKVDPAACDVAKVVAKATVGNPANSEWLDAAIGNFDGRGKQIALLKASHSNFFLLRPSRSTLTVTFSSDLNTDPSYPWRAVAAGDLDGDGVDELVAARTVSDGRGATVIAYKWTDATFKPVAISAFGNNGNSDWSGMTVGDFNGDGRAAIALVKDDHSNFAVLDLPPASVTLRVLATSDLDSAAGQDWRGVTATDWSGGDKGAAELVAVRAAKDPYRADLFVYGNPFHRASRDATLEGTRAQWDQARGVSPQEIVGWATESHTNTVSWSIIEPGDYDALVEFLKYTNGVSVDGEPLRVWLTLVPPDAVKHGLCSRPADSPLTPWNELALFAAGPGGDPTAYCTDYVGWGAAIGRLAAAHPHLVAFGVDDFLHHPELVSGEVLAEMQSRVRAQAPWVSFVPTAYHDDLGTNPPDMARTFDTMMFYFRNEKAKPICLTDPCGVNSVSRAPGEFADATAFMPAGRRLQVGTYWGQLYSISPPGDASNRYDYDLVRLARNVPSVAGVTAYPMIPKTAGFTCNEFNVLDDEFCTLRRVFGATPQPANRADLTSASGARPAAGNPNAYVFAAHGVENVIYRGADNHAHELWRTATGIGHSDLTALAGAPNVQGDPMAYVFAAQDIQNVVYRGTDNHVHGLYWSTGAVGHDDLTSLSGAPPAAGSPYGYVFDAIGFQNVLYRGADGRLHGLYWSCCGVGHDDLTALSGASGPAGDPFGYVFAALGVQNALYRGADGRLHGLHWSTGGVGHDDLTALSGAPAPSGNARAYVAPTYGLQVAVYKGVDNHLHGLYWSTGAVGHDDLTNASKAPSPASDPTGYFTANDGSHHIVYASADGHVHHLAWTVGVVSHDDLSALTAAPPAVGNPTAYLAADGKTQHVIFRSADGHLHDLVFGN
jgi:hypothetical protein